MEEIFKKMPEFEPDDKFIMETWNKIDNLNTEHTSNLFELVVNFVFALSIIVLTITSVLGVSNLHKTKEEVLVEINLVPKSDVLANSDDNLLFVYDEARDSEEVQANYEIDDNKLKLELKPGIYKLVFSSEEFQNVILTKIVTKNG